MIGNPSGSRKEHEDAFIKAMKADPAYLEMLARDYFERMSAVYMVREVAQNVHTFTKTGVSIDKGAQISASKSTEVVRRERAESAARAADTLAAMKAKVREVVLLDLPMPDGKLLREATGAECAKAGGFYEAVGRALKPTQVVDKHLSEGDLQNIRARFYQKNEVAA
jgi:hypothetical protein